MAQLDQQAAVVADDSTDSAAAQTSTTAEQPEVDTLDTLYTDEEPLADEAQGQIDPTNDVDPGLVEELPPIEPPHSWKTDAKEKFSALPREAQEIIAQRETERERFVQSKAQEAATARQQAQQEALAQFQQFATAQAQQYQQFAAQFEPQRPDPRLIAEDPDTYAAQLAAFEQHSAQRDYAQRQAQALQYQAQQAQQQQAAIEAQQTRAVLAEKFPEFLDENTGPKLRQELGSIAVEFGYPAELLAQASADEILGMKKAAEWRAKAAKYDDLQKRKMEAVRSAKQLKPLARPGVPAPSGQQAPTSDPLKLLYPND